MESLVENRWFAALLTIAVGCACGLLAKRIKVPAGYMIGAFVGVSALSISTGVAWLSHRGSHGRADRGRRLRRMLP